MSALDFLVELGTEELPPKALKTLADAFLNGIESGLANQQLKYQSAKVYATPRRLAVWVKQLSDEQPDVQNTLFGPPVSAARDKEGNPTAAATGFARKCGVSFDQLLQLETDKGTKLAWIETQKGKKTSELLPEIVAQSLERLPIPKRMRWGSSRVEFVRPTQWLVMLLGNQVIPCTILGQEAGNQSRGHRFHFNQPVTIAQASQYADQLEKEAYVIADFESRKALIKTQVEQLAIKAGGQAVIDPELLNEVTALVEWPVALLGEFDTDFLRIPDQALISSMKEHQKYFHLVDAHNALLPYFITIANIESTDPAQVIAGNERVIRPRLADAAFFFDTDSKTPLQARLEVLKGIVFQTQLGTLYQKAERIAHLSGSLAQKLGVNQQDAQRAGLLCKTDLVTQMVGEFPNLQGIMGQRYAVHDGEPTPVANAIFEHYLPRFAGDQLPQSLEGCAVSIADKLDTIAGLFAIGQPPTGDKDPFALRRAALGVLRIMVEKKLDLDLLDSINEAVRGYSALKPEATLADQIFEFMLERFRAWFQDEAIPTQVFQAVHARKPTQPLDFQKRIYAVQQFAALEAAPHLAAANKRVANILSKAVLKRIEDDIDTALLKEPAELTLAEQVSRKRNEIAPLLAKRDYTPALNALAELRPAVDAFFDQVMVMTDDQAVRDNRLMLLSSLRGLFLKVADISYLQS